MDKRIYHMARLLCTIGATLALLLAAGLPGVRVALAAEGQGTLLPVVTVSMDGDNVTIGIEVDNPEGLKPGVLDIRGDLPEGMALVNTTADGGVTEDGRVGWISTEQTERLVGFAYTLDTNGQVAPVLVSITAAGGELNGVYEASVTVGPGMGSEPGGMMQTPSGDTLTPFDDSLETPLGDVLTPRPERMEAPPTDLLAPEDMLEAEASGALTDGEMREAPAGDMMQMPFGDMMTED